MSAEDEVRQASDQFYAALNRMLNGDAGPMMEVWSHSSDVTTMHPVVGRSVTYTATQTYRFAEGKVAEIWANNDVFSLVQQLGLIPSMG
jgi:hypothetical protein